MATLELQNVPDELMKQIRRRAESHGVSLEEQVVRDLSIVSPEPRKRTEEEALLKEVRGDREEMAARGVYTTKELVDEAKNWGRKNDSSEQDRQDRAAAMIQEARAVRAKMPHAHLTQRDIRRARDEGRA